MATKFVLFAPEEETEARAYEDWCRVNGPDPSSPWALYEGDLLRDSNNNFVVAHLGPPFTVNSVVFEEPEGGPAMRETGVLVDTVTFPE